MATKERTISRSTRSAKTLPCGNAGDACTLLKIYLHQFFGEFGMADAQFLSQPDDALIHAQPRFETNGEKVQAVGEAHSNLVDTPVRCPLQARSREERIPLRPQ